MEEELTKEEKLAKRMAKIEYNKKKGNTNIFLFCTSIIQIAVTLFVVVGLFLASIFIVTRFLEPNSFEARKLLQILMFVEFIGGLILGFKIFASIVRFIIKKFNLEDKINQDVINRYKKLPKKDKDDN